MTLKTYLTLATGMFLLIGTQLQAQTTFNITPYESAHPQVEADASNPIAEDAELAVVATETYATENIRRKQLPVELTENTADIQYQWNY